MSLRLGIAWQDHQFLLSEWVWTDDAYLSLSVARNLALGNGMTSDGTHVTNGFQPLYVFLMVPVYLLVPPDDLVLPVHLAGTLLAVAGVAAAWVFYLIALRLYSRTVALCVLFFFCVSHYFVVIEINGLETPLYGLTLGLTLYYYLTRFIRARSPTSRQCMVLGVLAALTALTRVDALIALVCIAVHFAWVRRRALGPTLKQVAVGSAAFFVTMAPWLTANLVLCKTLVPDSGPAVRLLGIKNGWKPISNLIGYTGPERFTEDNIPWEYYGNNILNLTGQTIAFLPITAHAQGISTSFLARKVENFPIGVLLARAPRVALAIIVLGTVVMLAAPWFVKANRFRVRSGLGEVVFLRFAIVGWFAAYAFYVLCPWYTHRYLYPILVLLTLGSGAALQVFFGFLDHKFPRTRRPLVIFGAVVYTFLFVNQAKHYYTTDPRLVEPDRYSPVVPWIKEHVPADATIGAFQSGVLSYFLPHRCVNLDGVVNRAALLATREHRLWEYIREEGVDYIVDWPMCIDGLLTTSAGVQPLPLTTVYDACSMDVYKVGDEP